jgi:hypothetical protein
MQQQQMPISSPVTDTVGMRQHYYRQLQLQHQLLWQQEIQRQVVVAGASRNLKYIYPILPPDFPRHLDSIRAMLFSQQNAYTQDPMQTQLDELRRWIIASYAGVVARAPTKYSYARANHPYIPVRFGVSAPHCQSLDDQLDAGVVRAYRVRESWGDVRPPPEEEDWKHGQCAESQSLPSVVNDCKRIRFENVVIETMTVDRSGRPAGMCKNCIVYVYHGLLSKHPTWSVYDVAANKRYGYFR